MSFSILASLDSYQRQVLTKSKFGDFLISYLGISRKVELFLNTNQFIGQPQKLLHEQPDLVLPDF